jgi:hypothetical protein
VIQNRFYSERSLIWTKISNPPSNCQNILYLKREWEISETNYQGTLYIYIYLFIYGVRNIFY